MTVPYDAALGLVHELRDEPRYRHALTWVGQFWFFDDLHDDPRHRELRERLLLTR